MRSEQPHNLRALVDAHLRSRDLFELAEIEEQMSAFEAEERRRVWRALDERGRERLAPILAAEHASARWEALLTEALFAREEGEIDRASELLDDAAAVLPDAAWQRILRAVRGPHAELLDPALSEVLGAIASRTANEPQIGGYERQVDASPMDALADALATGGRPDLAAQWLRIALDWAPGSAPGAAPLSVIVYGPWLARLCRLADDLEGALEVLSRVPRNVADAPDGDAHMLMHAATLEGALLARALGDDAIAELERRNAGYGEAVVEVVEQLRRWGDDDGADWLLG